MAQDMWKMINRELAKIEQARGGASTTPYLDVVSETMRYAKEDRAWKERKNSQRQQIMGQLTQGTGMIFNEKDFEVIQNVFQYFYPRWDFSWEEVLKIRRSRPEFFEANQHIIRNEGSIIGTGQKLWKRAKRVIPGGNMLTFILKSLDFVWRYGNVFLTNCFT